MGYITLLIVYNILTIIVILSLRRICHRVKVNIMHIVHNATVQIHNDKLSSFYVACLARPLTIRCFANAQHDMFGRENATTKESDTA